MISHEKHIQNILSIVMWDYDHKYYVDKNTIKQFDSFMDRLDRTFKWYHLPITAEDIVVYVSDNTYDEYITSSSTEEETIMLGYGF